MEVIAWQLGIIVLVAVCWFVSRRAAFWLCMGLTAWTLAMLFYLPLIVIQLVAIWGTWTLLRHLSAQRDIVKKLAEEQQIIVRKTPAECRRILVGSEHRRHLNERIKKATEVIVVLSGWISDRVVDAEFAELLDWRLREGCQIYIGFGWRDSEGQHILSRRAKRALRTLEALKREHRQRLHVAQFGTHEKLLVTDDEVVFGSNNWLSSASFRNFERSLAVSDRELADRESGRAKRLVVQYETDEGTAPC